jgi:hypothetical protein
VQIETTRYDSLLKTFRNISKDVVAEIGSSDDLSRKISRTYQQFHGSITSWSLSLRPGCGNFLWWWPRSIA